MSAADERLPVEFAARAGGLASHGWSEDVDLGGGARDWGRARPCSAAPAHGSIGAVAERTQQTADAETSLNVGMAAERTWLAWWRTALVATAGALGGRG